jgi:hypothetical protein
VHVRRVQLPAGADRIAVGLSACCVGATVLGAAASPSLATPGAGMCPFSLLTGLPCPFCGLTRSMLALGEGHLGGAAAQNPLGLVLLPAAVLLLVAGGRAIVRGRRLSWPVPVLWIGLAVVVASWAWQVARYAT